MRGKPTKWTTEMDEKLRNEFPVRFSRDIGKDLNISIRTVIRRARFLGLEKEEGFLEKNKMEISERAQEAKAENPNKGNSNYRIPGGEKFQFKKGNIPAIKNNPQIAMKISKTRKKLIENERLRMKYGLKQNTKLRLNP